MPADKRKVAILGSGPSALTTAWYLSGEPGWQDRYEITVYQMGWRLGGKCATGRDPEACQRIEEHGIHGFLGSYYNTLRLMVDCYAELGRAQGDKLATFQEAFHPEHFVLMWEAHDGQLKRWPLRLPGNALMPWEPCSLTTIERRIAVIIELIELIFDEHGAKPERAGAEHGLGQAVLDSIGGVLRGLARAPLRGHLKTAREALEKDGLGSAGLLDALEKALDWIRNGLKAALDDIDVIRRLYITADFFITLVRGFIADDVVQRGFDALDDENFSDWLLRHGASTETVTSPLALNTTNLSYQYPAGDTSRPLEMAAGAYLDWTLREFAFEGAFGWLFAAGTGDTVIAPLFLVLRRRGVKFRFFNKVEALRLNDDGSAVAAIDIAVQATVDVGPDAYDPLIEVNGLPSWPDRPLFDQLRDGDKLKAASRRARAEGLATNGAGIDLESYWTSWQPVARETLHAGQDFDLVVNAISIGAQPYIATELLAANPAWRDSVEHVKTVQTQTMQLWFTPDLTALGWDIPLTGTDLLIGATYLAAPDGQADFTHYIPFEAWPADARPGALLYICGAMAEDGPPPPFDDVRYPRSQFDRVRWQSIQYLQAGTMPLLPKATTATNNPPGDPFGLDFSLLACHDEATAGQGVDRFRQQYWRANIDPSERYVTSPPGNTRYRLKAGDTGFDNLVVAGDWIYTGLNVGSVEGAVMGGMLAANAIGGFPKLADIIGYDPFGTDKA